MGQKSKEDGLQPGSAAAEIAANAGNAVLKQQHQKMREIIITTGDAFDQETILRLFSTDHTTLSPEQVEHNRRGRNINSSRTNKLSA